MLVCLNTSCVVFKDLFSFFPGTGSVSSGSAKSVSTLRSELEESLSGSASFPNSPATTAQLPKGRSPVSVNGVALQRQRQRDIYRQDLLSLSASTASSYHFRSRSHEALGPSMRTVQVLQKETWVFAFWLGYVLPIYDIP